MSLPVPEFIWFGREICADPRQAERREWVIMPWRSSVSRVMRSWLNVVWNRCGINSWMPG
jgi:hypothetical protein